MGEIIQKKKPKEEKRKKNQIKRVHETCTNKTEMLFMKKKMFQHMCLLGVVWVETDC